MLAERGFGERCRFGIGTFPDEGRRELRDLFELLRQIGLRVVDRDDEQFVVVGRLPGLERFPLECAVGVGGFVDRAPADQACIRSAGEVLAVVEIVRCRAPLVGLDLRGTDVRDVDGEAVAPWGARWQAIDAVDIAVDSK